MDVPVRPGDALSQPTRAKVFGLLGDLHRPASTDELAVELGMHPNGVRLHLERLLDEGLVERRRERQARGRPRDSWAISPDAQPGGDPPTGYASLSRWLVQALVTSGARVDDMEETGRLIGRGLASDHPGAKDEQMLFDTLTTLGFQPERQAIASQRVTYRLRNCPYRQAVHERQPLVCALHRGLTSGLVEGMDTGTVSGFEAKDPDLAGCIVRVSGLVEGQGRGKPEDR
ncbi:MAG: helix-turn-helix transcriptional regulator [Solirubrobacteraceae bacterium]